MRLLSLSAPHHLSTLCAAATLAWLAGCTALPPAAGSATAPAPSASTGAAATPAPTPAAASATTAPPSPAPEAAAQPPAGFAEWREAMVQEALAAGIRLATAQVLAQAQWLPRVIELDRSQPEFTRSPWAYLDSAVSPLRLAQGRQQREAYDGALTNAATRYGVPAEIITAIWGIESNYGSNFGSFRTVDALATLAFDGRRARWARSELLAALRILDAGDIAPERMVGSWAGAMGHTQFLPSVFLDHAVDADGDGHRDIWGSIPDVTASTARFLRDKGWKPGEPWLVEVRLPAPFDHAQADLSIRHTAAQWAATGVQPLQGGALPDWKKASVFTPAGARGPAFLVGPNFRTLLRYNNSTNYALAVGLLAQQIAGGPGVQAAWPRDLQPLSRQQTQALQNALNARGFDAGTADGLFGPATRGALRRYQGSQGLPADGYPTLELLQRLAP